MSTRDHVVIYHLYRQDGSSLFLHPFSSPAKLIAILEKSTPEGRYGHEPKVESLTAFRNELYHMIEGGVKIWVSELRFLPKFIISTAVFLAVYAILLVAVRDPLPMLDEVFLGAGAAVATFLLMGRKDMRSDHVLRKRVALRTEVDRIVFTESPFIRNVESLLHETESSKADDAMDSLLGSGKQLFPETDMEDLRRLLSYLERTFDVNELRRNERLVGRLSRKVPGSRTGELIADRLSSQKIDFPLFVLYTRIKREMDHTD